MLTDTQERAVELLLAHDDDEIIRKLKISRRTLDAWKRDPEFLRAIVDRMKSDRLAGARILTGLLVDACRELVELIRTGGDANRIKLLLDVVKAAGLLKDVSFEAAGRGTGTEEGDRIGELIERLADEPEDAAPGDED